MKKRQTQIDPSTQRLDWVVWAHHWRQLSILEAESVHFIALNREAGLLNMAQGSGYTAVSRRLVQLISVGAVFRL